MQDITVTLVQTNIVWKQIDENLRNYENHFGQVAPETDIIILPEMFNSGFVTEAEEVAEPPDGKTVQWLLNSAQKYETAIVGSLAIEESGRYYNRLFWVNPDGSCYTYNKRHLFSYAGEHTHFHQGKERIIIAYKGWNFYPQVCYDLRFPVWNRNRFQNEKYDYDCLIFIANWPEVRSEAWTSLLKARAIENMAYCIGVNRIGYDGHNIYHSGDSMVFDPAGEKLITTEKGEESIALATLSYDKMVSFRKRFPFANDWDNFHVKE